MPSPTQFCIEEPSIIRIGPVTSSASDGIGMMVPLANDNRLGAMAGDAFQGRLESLLAEWHQFFDQPFAFKALKCLADLEPACTGLPA